MQSRRWGLPAPWFAPMLSFPQLGLARSLARGASREDLAEALGYGARRLTRKEAVGALEAMGFRKTAAYKALTLDGKLGDLIEVTPDGLIEWKG
jgi:hypothetical protein